MESSKKSARKATVSKKAINSPKVPIPNKHQPAPVSIGSIRPNSAVLKRLTAKPERDSAVWEQVARWLKSGMIGDSIIRGSTPHSYNRIQEFQLGDPLHNEGFRYWHVEDLLEQMAGFLDRAITHRSEWRERVSKAFYVESEILEYIENDKVYANEVRDGLYEVPYVEAIQEAEALRRSLERTKYAQSIQREIYVNHYDSWRPETQISNWRWKVEERSSGVELFDKEGTNGAGDEKLVSANKRSFWEERNRLYKKLRADTARNSAELKVSAFTAPGGALNYRVQMAELQKRISRDSNDALSRLESAALGLKKIYGYEQILPPSIPKAIKSRVADHQALDDVLIWVRDALSWLTRFKQLDQNYVLPVSLRSLIDEAAWIAGKPEGKWQIVIPDTLFDGQSHVRLRGVRGYVYGCGQEAGFWRVELTPPTQATTRHLDSATRVNLDQSLLPKIVMPRVGSRLNAQEVEFVGTTTLYNTSPIGQWQIKISGLSTQRVPLDTIGDVELEFAIALRSSQ